MKKRPDSILRPINVKKKKNHFLNAYLLELYLFRHYDMLIFKETMQSVGTMYRCLIEERVEEKQWFIATFD